jgi:2'-5' RNA ligase
MPVSALVVFVPEAEPVVGRLRNRFDPSADQGVAAHITILVPFADPAELDSATLYALEQTFDGFAAFEFKLAEIGRFPQTTYLKPEPARLFVNLTQAVTRMFPSFQPYGGAHSEVIPHLTVSDGSIEHANMAELELCRAIAAAGAIPCVCDAVHLIDNTSGRWRTRQVFSLQSASGA